MNSSHGLASPTKLTQLVKRCSDLDVSRMMAAFRHPLAKKGEDLRSRQEQSDLLVDGWSPFSHPFATQQPRIVQGLATWTERAAAGVTFAGLPATRAARAADRRTSKQREMSRLAE